jgi:hypothetical protein
METPSHKQLRTSWSQNMGIYVNNVSNITIKTSRSKVRPKNVIIKIDNKFTSVGSNHTY